MIFRCRSLFSNSHIKAFFFTRKGLFSPLLYQIFDVTPPKQNDEGRRRSFFFAPLQASLTVEASITIPVFFLCMMTMLHFGTVMETAVRFGSALCETGERMAILSYASEYGETNRILTGGLSAAYARSSVLRKAGNTSAVKNLNFLLSSFLEEEDMIHLVMTYQVKSPIGGISIPGVFFLQRASVKGWTGRSGSEGNISDTTGEMQTGKENVYVTAHGTVYHRDLSCTHIKLSISQVTLSEVVSLRNQGGEKYHSCEYCGKNAEGQVYITKEGNRYHSTLECSGLKRTIEEVSLEEVEGMKACSKCGGEG